MFTFIEKHIVNQRQEILLQLNNFIGNLVSYWKILKLKPAPGTELPRLSK